jgi:putative transposase
VKSVTDKRQLVGSHKVLSKSDQCRILGIHRSGLYYKPCGESDLNLELMRLIDEKHIDLPYYGVGRICDWLNEDMGYKVNPKRIRRLFKVMNIHAVYPKPNTSKANKEHKIYPYLLRNLKIVRPNQVWEMDITYIPMKKGYMYMVAIIDVFSRYIVGWSLSNTMTTKWCKETYEEAVRQHGHPEILNTDQGSQFTSKVFTEAVTSGNITQLSMDGKGRALDNIFIERFWRSLKQEHVYLNPQNDGIELYRGIAEWMSFYNQGRRHSGISKLRPKDVYFSLCARDSFSLAS